MTIETVDTILGPRPPLFAKLKAWWGISARPKGLKAASPGKPVPRAFAPIDRLTVAQWLWGSGFQIPGGRQHVLDLVKPLVLNPATSLLDISAGLGGAARAIAAGFDTYVTGLERDPELARRAMAWSVQQGMAKRAPITAYEPETLELRPHAFDGILGRQATYAVKDKERFLRLLIASLKPRGQLLLTDFVIDPTVGPRPELAAWEQQQPYPPALWTLGQYTDCLTGIGFEIRIAEDITASYRGQILAGWERLLRKKNLRKFPRQHVGTIVDEAEFWMRSIAALESGALKLFRFHALAERGHAN